MSSKILLFALLIIVTSVIVMIASKSTGYDVVDVDLEMDEQQMMRAQMQQAQMRMRGYNDPRMIENFDGNYKRECGACLPTEGNPNIWTRKCVIKNSDGYNVGQYTTESTCVVCEDLGNRIKSCQTYDEQGQYVGETQSKIGMSFCS